MLQINPMRAGTRNMISIFIGLLSMGVCKSRNPTRNTRNPPGTPPGTLPGTPGTLPGTPGTLPGTPGTLPGTPGTPGTPPGTRWNTSYEATHVFLYKFTCFALNSGCWMVTIFNFTCIFVSLNNFSHGQG